MIRGLAVTAVVLAGAYLVAVAAAAVFQRQLIHLPDRSTPPVPADVEEVALRTDDGLELAAWFLPVEGAVSTVLVAPGNAGNRELRLPLARGLAARGHQVLLVEHRGYGGNPGRPSEAGLVADLLAARDHLEARDDVDPDRLVHLGESLGSAVATRLSVARPPALLVLRSPFPSLVPVARHHLPWLPVGTLLRDRFATQEHLPRVDAPVVVVAGDADRTVPPALSRQVADLVDAELVLVAGADHNDRALLDGDRYLDAVDVAARAAVGAPAP